MRVIGIEELREKLTVSVAIKLAEIAAKLEGQTDKFDRPERVFHPVGGDGAKFGIMPIILNQPPLLGLKVINIFPGNAAMGKPTHVGIYQLYSGVTGEALAMIDANTLTGIRTAAMTAFATRHIAPELTDHIAIIGSGDQARWHALTLGSLFRPKRMSVAGRNPLAAARLAGELARTMPWLDVEAIPTIDAVQEATVICTVTASPQPVIWKRWLGPRVHINAIGAHSPDCAELDEAILEGATCFTDDLAAFPTQCSEHLKLVAQGRAYPQRVYSLRDRVPEQQAKAGVTIYKSFGTAVQDLVFAAYVAGIDLFGGYRFHER
jgi:alanine dehydrogenase